MRVTQAVERDVHVKFEVAIHLGDIEYGRARGKSKKEAQQAAAQQALAVLEARPQGPPPK